MKQNILMMGSLPAEKMQALEATYTLHKLWQHENPEEALASIKNDVTGLISTVWSGASGRLIRALPNLEIIAHFGVGYDNVDVGAAKERGIIVTNTPDVLTDDTADMAMGLILAVLRRMVEGDIYVRSGQWAKKGALPLGRSLRGKTLGIVGMGRIGQAIASRASAFGMSVIYHGPRRKAQLPYPFFTSPEEIAQASDILVIACPYNTETHHLIEAKTLKALGKKGVLINIARGKIVDEAALVDALESGRISGAGLDVFEYEPDIPPALARLDNVVLQPHQGSATHETRAAMAQLVIDNLAMYFENATVLTPI